MLKICLIGVFIAAQRKCPVLLILLPSVIGIGYSSRALRNTRSICK